MDRIHPPGNGSDESKLKIAYSKNGISAAEQAAAATNVEPSPKRTVRSAGSRFESLFTLFLCIIAFVASLVPYCVKLILASTHEEAMKEAMRDEYGVVRLAAFFALACLIIMRVSNKRSPVFDRLLQAGAAALKALGSK